MPRVTIAPEADLATEINVLPLIDVLLVLIIVFFLMNRGLIFIPAEVPPPATPGASTDGGQIVLEVTAAGGFAVNQQPIPAAQLVTQLRAIYQQRRQKLLFVKVAPNRSYQEAIQAMDLAREAGVETLAWVPRPASAPGK
jgi:biopolymer transport protein ExbD